MKHIFAVLTVILIFFVLPDKGIPKEVILIANKDVEAKSFDEQTLHRIYHGKKKQWGDRNKIVPVMLKSGETHETFIEEILKETVYKFMTYWKQMVFTGRGLPPKALETEKEVVDFVALTSGAIGYISELPDSTLATVRLISLSIAEE
ncbi:MAG: hypothetical protein HN356_05480 [Calditrichaeota bacterium]|jgi:ABC-type phosphate transport system substrate-binding protein|nr:hypothetical protein [Calditrichota bacterium]MBT7618635.1 hypothetical protein [Calditrichota bacterium]MBT7790311.1 hypothetical protein [Calditrichota bacterium]